MATGSYKNCACHHCKTEHACYIRDWVNCKPCGTSGFELDIRKPHGSNHYRRCKDIIKDGGCYSMKQLWRFNRVELKKIHLILSYNKGDR